MSAREGLHREATAAVYAKFAGRLPEVYIYVRRAGVSAAVVVCVVGGICVVCSV